MLNVDELLTVDEKQLHNRWNEISKNWINRSVRVPPFYNEKTKLNERTFLSKQHQLNDIYELTQPLISQIANNNMEESSCIVDAEGFVVYYCFGPQPGLGMQCNATTGINSFVMTDLVDGKTIEVQINVETDGAIIDTLMAPIFDINKHLASILMYGSVKEIPPVSKMKFYLGAQLIEERFQNKQKLNLYANSIINGVSDCALLLDEHSRILQVNDKCIDLLGISENEIIGRQMTDIMWKGQSDFNIQSNGRIMLNSKGNSVSCTIINQHRFPVWNDRDELLLIFKAEQEIRQQHLQLNSPFDELIGETPIMKRVKTTARRIAKKPCNVLIRGETGTGKELLAKAIHWESGRKGAFVPINCGAIPRELLQSELFGYEEGTFTGARKGGKIGKIESADGGTVFLDEIGEMPSDMQVTLLRVLQDKMINKIGGNLEKNVDVRIIAATNANLEEAIAEGSFREDLYYRLNVFNIITPPLRQRREDIPLIIDHVLEQLCREYSLFKPLIDKEAMDILMNHYWKGNVRELRNVVESALLTCSADIIDLGSLPDFLLQQKEAGNTVKNIKNYEKEAIEDALVLCNGNISQAAKMLGITRNTLYKKRSEYMI